MTIIKLTTYNSREIYIIKENIDTMEIALRNDAKTTITMGSGKTLNVLETIIEIMRMKGII